MTGSLATYQPFELTVLEANSEQTRVCRESTFEFWGPPSGMTLEQYQARYDAMDKETTTQTWILVPRSNPHTTIEILSLCETYRRRAIVVPPLSDAPREVVAYAVSSVFTAAQYRRRGYGKLLLQLMHYCLASHSDLPPFPSTWGAPPAPPTRGAALSVLYSDIGSSFYEACTQGEGESSRLGWVETGAVGRSWLLGPPVDRDDSAEELEIRWLDREGIRSLGERLSEELVWQLKEGEGPGEAARARVAFLPTSDLLAIPALRSLLSDPAILHPFAPRTFGFTLPPSPTAPADRPPPTAIYTFSSETPDHQTLLLTYISGVVPFSAVVAAARRERCDRIEIWGDDEISRAWRDPRTGKEGTWERRTEHLPSLTSYVGEVEWVDNARYSWC